MKTEYSTVLTSVISALGLSCAVLFANEVYSAARLSEKQNRNALSWNSGFTGTDEQNVLQVKRRKSMNQKKKIVNIRIRPNQKYEYDLGSFGDEEGARIQKQASHFSVSEVHREPESARYFYTPEKDYTGTDEVEIVIERGSDGASPSTDFTVIIIKFTISKK